MSAPRLLAFAGSTRRESFNKRLVRIAADVARAAGAEVTLAWIEDYPMPLFDADLEGRGTPEAAKDWKALLESHDGFLISSPEYNSSYSGVLKNAIDWASRPVPGERPLAAFAGKTAGLMAASPGALGGIRMLPQLRNLLMNIRVVVVPEQFGLSHADKAFDAEGGLIDAKHRASVENVVHSVVRMTRALRAAQ